MPPFRAPRPVGSTRARTRFFWIVCLFVVGSVGPPALFGADEPVGRLEFHDIVLEPPPDAIEAYLEDFSTRQWVIGTETQSEFVALTFGLELSLANRDMLLDRRYWASRRGPEGWLITPPVELLTGLTAAERKGLYRLLAIWPQNKAERWPLVIRDETVFESLSAQGIPPEFINRVRSLCYPFPGGHALSDFALVAQDFRDREQLRRFLRAISTVQSQLPRVRLDRVDSIADALEYWTVSRHNLFAAPLLEALLEARSVDGIEVVSIMPRTTRTLFLSSEADNVRHDHSAMSFIISASLAHSSLMIDPQQPLREWLGRSFEPLLQRPLRYGDVLVVETRSARNPPYACAQILDDVVFARDPVGLGLWQFMSKSALLRRNPHFEGAELIPWRVRAP